MHLSQLLAGLCYTLHGNGDIDIGSLACHTANVHGGCMFFCIKGANVDGNQLVSKAVGDGAVVVVCDHILPTAITQVVVNDVRLTMALVAKAFYNNCVDSLHVVSVVGTNGKTSCTYIMEGIFSRAGYNTGIIGSNGVFINGKHYSSTLTTPDPIDMHYWLYQMYLNHVQYVFVEISAHAIYYNKHTGIVADMAVFTNCSQDHLDFFGDMDSYSSTKMRYFCQHYANNAVVNIDDKIGRAIADSSNIPCFSYGCSDSADIYATNYCESIHGMSYTLHMGQQYTVNSQLHAQFNVYNTLCAISVARLVGIDMPVILDAIADIASVEGRNNTIVRSDNVNIVVDFAHTPDGIDNILGYLRTVTDGNLIVVFGCGGNRDKFKRPLMAEAVSRYADYAIVTNDNPRHESPLGIVGDITPSISCNYCVLLNRSQATQHALAMAKCGDTIAILGKGAEKYQEIKGRKYPYNDIEVVQKLIR